VEEDDSQIAVEEDVAAHRGNVVLTPVGANIPMGTSTQTAPINQPTSSGQQPQLAAVLSEADKVIVTDPRSALRQAKLLAEELSQPYISSFFNSFVLLCILYLITKNVFYLFLSFVGVFGFVVTARNRSIKQTNSPSNSGRIKLRLILKDLHQVDLSQL
jgi:hypothetical protein